MYAPTLADPNCVSVCASSCEGPVNQPVTDEANLVQRLRTGDETAVRELIERYGPRIYRVAYGILRNPGDADDIAQEVFAKVSFSITSFQGFVDGDARDPCVQRAANVTDICARNGRSTKAKPPTVAFQCAC
jgi:hypothetical protein